MASSFKMKVGEKEMVGELLEEEAPNICEQFIENLPVKSIAVHAKFAGLEIISMLPFYCEPENEIFHVDKGDIGYYPGRQTICIFYGDTKPFGEVSVFAKIKSGLEETNEIGEIILENGLVPVEFSEIDIS